jgi:hypothetical protein
MQCTPVVQWALRLHANHHQLFTKRTLEHCTKAVNLNHLVLIRHSVKTWILLVAVGTYLIDLDQGLRVFRFMVT